MERSDLERIDELNTQIRDVVTAPPAFTSLANPPVSWPIFTLTEVDAVHHAIQEAKATANDRREKMPSSAQAFDRQAAQLKTVLDKMLRGFPPDVRRRYGLTDQAG